jgi:hypothetical protein
MRPASTRSSITRRFGIILIAVALAVPGSLAWADGPEPIFAAVREAVAADRIDRSEVVGFNLGPAVVRDKPPESGILVGFELGLGERLGAKSTVYSLRPLYLTPSGMKPSQTFGLAQGRTGKGKNPPRSKVTRTVTVQAKPGYAVGAVLLDTGLTIDALAVNFMRINGTSLDPTDAYTGDWIGSREEKKPGIVTWKGDPIVGVLARENETHIIALGLVRMRPAEPERAAPPPPKPATRPSGPARAEGSAKAAQDAGPPAEAKPSPAAPADASSDDGGIPWLPISVFAVVSVAVFGVAMLVLRLKDSTSPPQEHADADPPERRRRRRRRRPPPDDGVQRESDEDVPEVLPADEDAGGRSGA